MTDTGALRFTTILLDPPWPERGGGKSVRGAQRHYPLVAVRDMPSLIRKSTAWRPADACSVWMWATVNHLDDALWLMRMLGARYITNVVWVKGERDNNGVRLQHGGLGQRFRIGHEHLLYGRIGNVPKPPPESRLPSVLVAPRRRHSQKPEESFRLIETHDPPGLRMEMFARTPREGWHSWGNEIEHTEREGLRR